VKRPSYKQVSKLLQYDPKTGALTWRVAGKNRTIGKSAGTVVTTHEHRYCYVRVLYERYPKHHVAWLLMVGKWPGSMIKFKDRDGTNCRWDNLEPTEIKAVRRGSRIYRNNTSGYRGVGFRRSKQKWFARIYVNGQRKFLGYHMTERVPPSRPAAAPPSDTATQAEPHAHGQRVRPRLCFI
jgi:hypothetical protein